MWEAFISRKSCKTYENSVKSPKLMSPFIFSKAVQIGVFVRPILVPGPALEARSRNSFDIFAPLTALILV